VFLSTFLTEILQEGFQALMIISWMTGAWKLRRVINLPINRMFDTSILELDLWSVRRLSTQLTFLVSLVMSSTVGIGSSSSTMMTGNQIESDNLGCGFHRILNATEAASRGVGWNKGDSDGRIQG
jgi:hypothetical protein